MHFLQNQCFLTWSFCILFRYTLNYHNFFLTVYFHQFQSELVFISNTSQQTWVTEKMIFKKKKQNNKAAWNIFCVEKEFKKFKKSWPRRKLNLNCTINSLIYMYMLGETWGCTMYIHVCQKNVTTNYILNEIKLQATVVSLARSCNVHLSV